MHGYELVQAIRTATDDALAFGEGCVYPILHRLESQGLLSASRENVGGRQRVVLLRDGRGRAQLNASVSAWRDVVASVNRVLQGGEHGRAALA